MKLRRLALLFALIIIGSLASQAKTYTFTLHKVREDMIMAWNLTYDGKVAKLEQNVMSGIQFNDDVLREEKISRIIIADNGALGFYNDKGALSFAVLSTDNGKANTIAYFDKNGQEVDFGIASENSNNKFLSTYKELKSAVESNTYASSSSTTTSRQNASSTSTLTQKVLTIKDFADRPFGFLTLTQVKTVASTLKALGAAGWPDKPSLSNPDDLVSIENRAAFTIPYTFEGIPVRGMSTWYKKGVLWRYNLYCYRLKSQTSLKDMVQKAKNVIVKLKEEGYILITTDPTKYPNYDWKKDYIFFATMQKGNKRINIDIDEGTDYKSKDSYVLNIYVYP